MNTKKLKIQLMLELDGEYNNLGTIISEFRKLANTLSVTDDEVLGLVGIVAEMRDRIVSP